MTVQIQPEHMAQIYFNRLRYAALHEVKGIIRYFHKSGETVRYWMRVLKCLERRLPELPVKEMTTNGPTN